MGSTDSTDYAAGPPPPDGNQNRGGQILAVDAVIFGISWSMVLLRTVVRLWITRNFGWDDATILIAAVSVVLSAYLRPLREETDKANIGD